MAEHYREIRHAFVDRFNNDEEVQVGFRFRRPSAEAVERCQAKVGKKPSLAYRSLCIHCVQAEDKQAMLEAFDAYPGLPTSFGNALLEAAGFADLGN
ncbi:MAG: hypothetical protein RBR13_09535 [Tenuifilaceae bacterium]|nr:hypothetical protein [Tenuifilaceae bacterium]